MFRKLTETWRVYRGLTAVPELVAKAFLLGSIALIIASAIALVTLPDKSPWQILPTIVISVATSALAAALYTVSAAMRELWRREERQKRFTAFLGVDRPPQNFVVVLPRFPTTLLTALTEEIQQGVPRMISPDIAGCVKSLLLSDSDFASVQDVKAAMHLVASFDEVGMPVPRIAFDDEVIDELDKVPNTAYFAVGLESNLVTMKVNSVAPSQRLFGITPSSPPKGASVRLARVEGREIVMDDSSPDAYKDLQKSRFALVAKVQRHASGNTVVIVGGLAAPATEDAGKYFRDKWEELAAWRDASLDRLVEANAYAGVIEFDKSGAWVTKRNVRVGGRKPN